MMLCLALHPVDQHLLEGDTLVLNCSLDVNSSIVASQLFFVELSMNYAPAMLQPSFYPDGPQSKTAVLFKPNITGHLFEFKYICCANVSTTTTTTAYADDVANVDSDWTKCRGSQYVDINETIVVVKRMLLSVDRVDDDENDIV